MSNLRDFGKFKSRKDWDQAIAQNAAYFTACKFLGRAQYKTLKADTLEQARVLARELVCEYGGNVMIYAVSKEGHSAHVENFP